MGPWSTSYDLRRGVGIEKEVGKVESDVLALSSGTAGQEEPWYLT